MRREVEHTHLDLIAAERAVRDLARAMRKESGAAGLMGIGSAGSSTTLAVGAASRLSDQVVVLVVAHLDDADEAVDELGACGVEAVRLPALEVLPGESNVSLDLFAERVAVVRRVLALDASGEVDGGFVIVCPIQALMQGVPAPARLDDVSVNLSIGRAFESRGSSGGSGLDGLVRWLDAAGYRRGESIEEPGDFAVRGGILDVFPPGATSATTTEGVPVATAAVRLDFFGDELESITEIDLGTMGSGAKLSSVELVGASLEKIATDEGTVCFLELLPRGATAVVAETIEVTEQGRGYFERVVDARGITGPPAVFRLLRERFAAFVEINQFGGAGSSRSVGTIGLPARVLPEFARDVGEAIKELGAMSASHRVVVLCQNEGELSRLEELLAEFAPGAPIERAARYLHRGFIWGEEEGGTAEGRKAEEASSELEARSLEPSTLSSKPQAPSPPVALVPYHELLHRYHTRRRIRRLKSGKSTEAFLDLQVGDYVVHTDHGIARFTGLKTLKPKKPKATAEEEAEEKLKAQSEKLKAEARKRSAIGKKQAEGADAARAAAAPGESGEEYLTLEFATGSKLHVPVAQIDKVQKYIGGFQGKPPLSTLGGTRWKTQKERVKESVRDLAKELLRVQAARESMPGVRYPADTAWQKEFEAEFPYQETEDQLAALSEIKKDMTRERPMDRLLCGDVGYGKTELAIRAAFKAVEFGKQVAVLVPTTILAEQHERTFKQRFADYPFRVESLSRFKTNKEINDTLAAARKGQVDILIGTHRLLSKDVKFADLGLVVIDEEQRFGVEHKNALLSLRMTVDVLTLSATPIPRTLHMSMLGLRDISSLSTAPMDRRAVVTEVIPYNEKRIAQAIARELAREGQVYFVHNRVHNIQSVADDIQKLAPGAKILIGHGQMPDDELERVMRTFIGRQADILVSTTIIESGIDIPTANTMLINGADRFGLAELHQLRGRVGRYKHRAYCYLLLPQDRPVTDIAARRLRAIEEFSMLGAGFKIAMRDLEIRGAGNLLGAEQSGHIAAVGYDMYCRLLDESAHELRNEKVIVTSETTIEIGVLGSLPKTYIPSDARRLEAYRRIASAPSIEQLGQVARDIRDAYGELPKGAERLFDVARVRIGVGTLGVRSVTRYEQDVIFRGEKPLEVQARLDGAKGTVRILPVSGGADAGMHEVYWRPPPAFLEPETLLTVLLKRFGAA